MSHNKLPSLIALLLYIFDYLEASTIGSARRQKLTAIMFLEDDCRLYELGFEFSEAKGVPVYLNETEYIVQSQKS